MSILLSDDDANQIADLLSLLQDWLLHADEHVLERLGRYVWPGTCAPQQYVGALIDRLGDHSHHLIAQLTAGEQDEPQGSEHGPRAGIA